MEKCDIVSYLTDEKGVYYPPYLYNFNGFDERLLKGITGTSINSYLLLPKKYVNLNFNGESVGSEDSTDNLLLAGLLLVRSLLQSGSLNLVVVFDNAAILSRFERMSATIHLRGANNRIEICSLGDGRVFKACRQGKEHARKTYITTIGRQKAYPRECMRIPLALFGDLGPAGYTGAIAVYIKTRCERYASGFPRYRPLENRISRSIGSEKMIVLAAGLESLPKMPESSNYTIFASGEFVIPQVSFIAKPHSLPILLKAPKKDFEKLVSGEFGRIQSAQDASMAIALAVYDGKENASLSQEMLIQRASESSTMQAMLRDVCDTLRKVSEISRLPLALGSWKDIAKAEADSEGHSLQIYCYPELECMCKMVFGTLLFDLFYASEFVKRSGTARTLGELEILSKKTTESLVRELGIRDLSRMAPIEEYDPEESITHIASNYDYSPGDQVVDAHYFILKDGAKKYMFFCRLEGDSRVSLANSSGEKRLSELKVGDVIKKDYWDYGTLRAAIIRYTDKEPRDKEALQHALECSDKFRELLQRYAISTPVEVLNREYRGMCAATNMKNFLMGWSFTTMRPDKKEMLRKVVDEINLAFGSNLDFNFIYHALSKLRGMRSKIGEEDEFGKIHKSTLINYEIIEGPIKARVEVERLGKIFRVS